MLSFVSLPIEILRTRPRLLVAFAVLAQAALWVLLPALLYWSPPGGVPEALAFGRHAPAGGPFGPPLSFWLAEVAFRAFGLFGGYLLSQLCVAVTFVAVFLLGRAIVGECHAAIAVLLMAGMAVFAAPAPEFGPAVLSMPLWALLLLHVRLAVWHDRRLHWLGAGAALGLLLLTSYANLWLAALLAGYVAWSERGRAQFTFVEPFVGLLVALLVLFPHLIWLDRPGSALSWPAPGLAVYAQSLGWLVVFAVLAHVGLGVLVVLAQGLPGARSDRAPEIVRPPADAEGRRFVAFFALAPISAALLLPLLPGSLAGMPAVAPLLLLSGLAAVLVLGERIRIVHQHLIGWAWAALVLAPAAVVVLVLAIVPSLRGTEFGVTLPSSQMGRTFAAAFERRTGRPFAIVTGDPRTAALVALGAPSRPELFLPAAPQNSPRVTRQDIEARGAVVVWRATGTRGVPPPEVAAQFPGLVLEVPQAFDRRFQGFGPASRIGWAVIRPRSPAAAGPVSFLLGHESRGQGQNGGRP